MNEIINRDKKPYIVIEGVVEYKNYEIKNNSIIEKYPIFTILYAGGIREEFGILKFVKIFKKINNSEINLHIYGSGNEEEELREIIKNDNRIKYFGKVSSEEIMKYEEKATLLINPRPTDRIFTKYSFPSKIMEYLSSGTPILSTKLSGISEEYEKYIIWVEKETEIKFIKQIEILYNTDRNSLKEIGLMGKAFVNKEKNKIVQAKKVIQLIKKMEYLNNAKK
jgi:glycosyltransferase involved in cell wall biosynthesis